MSIRTLIVDDEPLARERIRDMLKHDHEIEIVGECAAGNQALAAIKNNRPDLLFLDVQMPQMDGFSVLKKLEREQMPTVVFVTAYDKYAVRAFEVHALDYLLKPFKRKRFEEAVRRAKTQISQGGETEIVKRTLALLKEVAGKPKYLERLVIKTTERAFFLKTNEIDWIGTEDNYVRIYSGKESYLMREPMNNLEQKLDPSQFARVHRRTIVNLDRIREFRRWFNREYRVVLKDGTELPISRTYKEKLGKLLGRA